MRYFYGSLFLTFVGAAGAFVIGGWAAVYITFLLMILEVSLSFDNAVVNAKVLETLDPVWQRRFILFGIPIAVFGMRLVFPLLIVGVATGLGFVDALEMAINDSERYEAVLKQTEDVIFAFGGAFLLMVFLDFFFKVRDVKWMAFVEGSKIIERASSINHIELIVAIAMGLVLGAMTQEHNVLMAFLLGVLLHSLLSVLDDFLSSDTVKSGLAGFIYLEVLDASFSFDGVIGAFALTSNIFIIMIGLGVGAMFVRSMTIYFVEHKTLSHFRYLEHGAHYAIGVLALIMLLKITLHVSELVTGTIGVGLIAIAFAHSVWENKKTMIS